MQAEAAVNDLVVSVKKVHKSDIYVADLKKKIKDRTADFERVSSRQREQEQAEAARKVVEGACFVPSVVVAGGLLDVAK